MFSRGFNQRTSYSSDLTETSQINRCRRDVVLQVILIIKLMVDIDMMSENRSSGAFLKLLVAGEEIISKACLPNMKHDIIILVVCRCSQLTIRR